MEKTSEASIPFDAWSVKPVRERTDLAAPGSPERCVARHVIEDVQGRLLLVEQLRSQGIERYEAVARLLDRLAQEGVRGVLPYLAAPGGTHVVERGGHAWRVSPFVVGDELVRPAYALDSVRGKELGSFLCSLRRTKLAGCVAEIGRQPLLGEYAHQLTRTVHEQRPELAAQLQAVYSRLQTFFESEPLLKTSLCHGDVHPLNVIWSASSILAVIDWEFAGLRPGLYDAANCLGCVGSEGPDAFGAGLCRTLVRTLRDGGGLEDSESGWLVQVIAASRWGWLSEWLRRADDEMIRFEFQYLEYLTCNQEQVRQELGI